MFFSMTRIFMQFGHGNHILYITKQHKHRRQEHTSEVWMYYFRKTKFSNKQKSCLARLYVLLLSTVNYIVVSMTSLLTPFLIY